MNYASTEILGGGDIYDVTVVFNFSNALLGN